MTDLATKTLMRRFAGIAPLLFACSQESAGALDAGVYGHHKAPQSTWDAGGAVDMDAGSPIVDAGTDAHVVCTSGSSGGGTWQALTNQPAFDAMVGLLLTDGTVMVHVNLSPDWWLLTPDINGSYTNGTWKQLASLPAGYGPRWFASAVLPDGRVLIEGGEYNLTEGTHAETTLGAIYDPTKDTWTAVAPPPMWTEVGDAPGVVLPNGTFMMGNILDLGAAVLFDATTLTWTSTGSGKADSNSEEGWTLLPGGRVLTIDTHGGTESETYDPSTGMWSDAGSTVVQLASAGEDEIGPAMLMPNGTVFATGATVWAGAMATGNTALRAADGSWSAGPPLPCNMGDNDGPAALLPNGHVLVPLDDSWLDSYYFEFDGSAYTMVPTPPGGQSAANTTLLVLPTGEVIAFRELATAAVYTPAGAADPSWAPTITGVPTALARGSSYTLSGTQLNGLSQAVSYGDDVQAATNYPLVRITNTATGHVFYARTHDHSTMAVATGSKVVSTQFDVSITTETGASELVVVANGIASAPVVVTVN